MGKPNPPTRRTETPFLTGARNGDPLQELYLRIALAHDIVDQSQVTNVDLSALQGQANKALTTLQIQAYLASNLQEEAPPTESKRPSNSRLSKWLPKHNT